MKQSLFLVFLFAGLLMPSMAQHSSTVKMTSGTQRSTTGSNFKGGIRAGFTATQISGDDLGGFHKLGACAGLFINFPLTDNLRWKIQSELDFIMKGSHAYYSSQKPITDKYVLNIGYLEVPVLIKWTFAENFEIEFGPAFGVILYQRERNAVGPMKRPPFRWYELSGLCGLSYIIKKHFGISLRYSNSLIPVRIPDWVFNRHVKKQYNSVLALSVTYQF